MPYNGRNCIESADTGGRREGAGRAPGGQLVSMGGGVAGQLPARGPGVHVQEGRHERDTLIFGNIDAPGLASLSKTPLIKPSRSFAAIYSNCSCLGIISRYTCT